MPTDDEQLADEPRFVTILLAETAQVGYQLRRGGGPLLDLVRQAASVAIDQDDRVGS